MNSLKHWGRDVVSRVPFLHRRLALVRRFTGYSAGSVIAALTSELAFLAVIGWTHAGTTWASAAGFVGGAVPNYVLNRRWAWSGPRSRSRNAEVILYMTVALASFVSAAVATHWTESVAKQLTIGPTSRTLLLGGVYLAVSALFFVAKFVIYEKVVFVPGREPSAARRFAEPAVGVVAGESEADAEPVERLVAHQVVTTTRAKRNP
jgi:putative flippase GtrA